jgi:hypothetical protein
LDIPEQADPILFQTDPYSGDVAPRGQYMPERQLVFFKKHKKALHPKIADTKPFFLQLESF